MQGAKLLNIFIINKFLSVFYSPTMICLICLRLRRGNIEFDELTNFIGTGNGRFARSYGNTKKSTIRMIYCSAD